MSVEVQGLDAMEGETAFAFFVVRMREPVSRDQIVAMLRYVAPLIPDSETFIDELPDDLEQAIRILAMPWNPPEAGHAVDAQRRLIESAGGMGVEAAWFFQTGTSLPDEGGIDDDDEDDEDDDDGDDELVAGTESGDPSARRARTKPEKRPRAMTLDDDQPGEPSFSATWSSGEIGGDTKTTPIEIIDMSRLNEADVGDDTDLTSDEELARKQRKPADTSTARIAPVATRDEGERRATGDDGDRLATDDEDEAADEDDDADEDGDDDFGDEAALDDDLDDDDADDDDDEDDEDDEDHAAPVTWSHGPPPQVTRPKFPVDGYPGILDDVDWEDFGIAVKLRGDMLTGEGTVLYGFHTLWLAPYGGRYRNAAVTIDRKHHSAHLWVDRFAVPCSAEQQVHHLLWILSKLHEIVPIVHARFAGATIAQKYAGLMGDTSEPVVLGGNPLVSAYALAGDAGVDRWIAQQTDWSREEVAQMLRELAIEIVTARPDDNDGDPAEDEAAPGAPVEADLGRQTIDDLDEGDDDEDDDDDDDDDDDGDDGDEDGDEDDDGGDDDDDDEAEGNEDEDRGRHITTYAGELLAARAAAGKLDARAAERLLPVLAMPEKYEHRRRAVVQIMGALRYRPAVPALIKILEDTTIASALDSVGKEELVAATAQALGTIGDPSACGVLARVVAAPGTHNDEPRAVAADALAACLAAAPEPRQVDDAVLAELLTTIRERNDGELNAESQLAYGRIVRQLPAEHRGEARRRLADCDSARDDSIALLARQAALVLTSAVTQGDVVPRDVGPLLHESLTAVDYDHEYTVRNLRIALRVAEIVPDLVAADDLVWLTRFAESDIRDRAHALLARLGRPLPPAAVFDGQSARQLGDDELVLLIGEAHVVGRAALIAEAGRRGLERARRAIIDACHDVISRARQGSESLLDPDTAVLDAAVPQLRRGMLDGDVIALFDRMLRHPSYHVKWELLQQPPHDPRLIGGMFHVLGAQWGWQEKTAKRWLADFQGTEAYEIERKRASTTTVASVSADEDDDDDGSDGVDDEDIN